MTEVHATYDKRRVEKLCQMFTGDPRDGNPTLFIREHFNLRRICENCETRSSSRHLAAASLIAEGTSWVVPFSITQNGRIIIDLEASIPDQSMFFSDTILRELRHIGIECKADGELEYIIPIQADRDEYFRSVRRTKYADYRSVLKRYVCRVITDASPEDVLKWDTEVEYDYESYQKAKFSEIKSGFSVESEYFQWLAQAGQLVVTRISDENDVTIVLGYFVPMDYELVFVTLKRRHGPDFRRHGLGNALFFMAIDHVYEKGLLTPVNVGTTLYQYKEIWSPVPVVKPRLVFANLAAQQAMVARFSKA